MPPAGRPRHDPTDDWTQIQLFVSSPEQETYELLRPIVLFGQPARTRALDTGAPAALPGDRVARVAEGGLDLREGDPAGVE